jgi:hypothetical protein
MNRAFFFPGVTPLGLAARVEDELTGPAWVWSPANMEITRIRRVRYRESPTRPGGERVLDRRE